MGTRASMKPLFLGSHPAMDFLNTRPTPRGAPIELIGDGTSYVTWLEGAQLLHATTAQKLSVAWSSGAGRGCREARELREWARDWIARWAMLPAALTEDGAPPLEPPAGASTVLSRTGRYEGRVSGHRAPAHRFRG